MHRPNAEPTSLDVVGRYLRFHHTYPSTYFMGTLSKKNRTYGKTTWWLKPTHLKHISQNGFIFPKFRMSEPYLYIGNGWILSKPSNGVSNHLTCRIPILGRPNEQWFFPFDFGGSAVGFASDLISGGCSTSSSTSPVTATVSHHGSFVCRLTWHIDDVKVPQRQGQTQVAALGVSCFSTEFRFAKKWIPKNHVRVLKSGSSGVIEDFLSIHHLGCPWS